MRKHDRELNGFQFTSENKICLPSDPSPGFVLAHSVTRLFSGSPGGFKSVQQRVSSLRSKFKLTWLTGVRVGGVSNEVLMA